MKMGHRQNIQSFETSIETVRTEYNDPSVKYENLEKMLKIRRFRLSPSSGMVVAVIKW